MLTEMADRIAQRYGLLLESFHTALVNAFLQPWSDQAQSALSVRLYEISSSALAELEPDLAEHLLALAGDAVETTAAAMLVPSPGIFPAVVEHVSYHTLHLNHALRLQVERDIATTLAALRQVALRETLQARASGKGQHISVGVRRDAQAALRHDFIDRAGKHWPSQKFVRTLVRQTLVLVWNETALLLMAEHGQNQAVIQHPDRAYHALGELISFTPEVAGMSWLEAGPLFHPNTHAHVTPLDHRSSHLAGVG